MALSAAPTWAILRAQFQTVRNFFPRSGRLILAVSWLFTLIWYGLWLVLAAFLGYALARPEATRVISEMMPNGLLLVTLYWQLVPLLLVTSGFSIELKKLMIYPIPEGQLFWIEALLRLSTSMEMVLVLAGAAVGMARNPAVPLSSVLVLAIFGIGNILTSVGLRDLLTRLLARRGWREIVILFFVTLAALPQYVSAFGWPAWLSAAARAPMPFWLPWSAAARAALDNGVAAWILLVAWLAVTYRFARGQFHRSLRFDTDEARSSERTASRSPILEFIFQVPRHLFRDPLAALVEKELRFLSRAPRFRLVFLMGFSFGIILWLPMAFGGFAGALPRSSSLSTNFLTIVCVYAVTLLGEVAFWNNLGFDRSAAQIYFLAPVRFETVLVAKNIAGMIFVLLELFLIIAMVLLLRLPFGPAKFAEALLATLGFAIYLLTLGNFGSVRYPRTMDPAQSWRTSSGSSFHALLLVLYPLTFGPVLIAYGARYVFKSESAFYLVMVLGLVVGIAIYRAGLHWACSIAEQRREQILSILTAGAGPIS